MKDKIPETKSTAASRVADKLRAKDKSNWETAKKETESTWRKFSQPISDTAFNSTLKKWRNRGYGIPAELKTYKQRLAIGLLLVALGMFATGLATGPKGWETAEATLTKISDTQGTGFSWDNTFTVNNETYHYSEGLLEGQHEPGDTGTLLYNPKNPDHNQKPRDKTPIVLTGLFVLVGLVVVAESSFNLAIVSMPNGQIRFREWGKRYLQPKHIASGILSLSVFVALLTLPATLGYNLKAMPDHWDTSVATATSPNTVSYIVADEKHSLTLTELPGKLHEGDTRIIYYDPEIPSNALFKQERQTEKQAAKTVGTWGLILTMLRFMVPITALVAGRATSEINSKSQSPHLVPSSKLFPAKIRKPFQTGAVLVLVGSAGMLFSVAAKTVTSIPDDWHETTAEMFEVTKHTRRTSSGASTVWKWKATYLTEGENHTASSTGASSETPRVGDIIIIAYNPEFPSDSKASPTDNQLTSVWVMAAIGATSALVGTILMINTLIDIFINSRNNNDHAPTKLPNYITQDSQNRHQLTVSDQPPVFSAIKEFSHKSDGDIHKLIRGYAMIDDRYKPEERRYFQVAATQRLGFPTETIAIWKEHS